MPPCFEAQLQSPDSFGIGASQSYERLDSPFSVTRGVVLPTGAEYDFTRLRFFGQTANRRVIALQRRYERGGYYSGERAQKVMQLTVRARPGHIFYINGEWNDVQLPEGHFSLNVYRVVAETQFPPFVAFVNNVQYDNASRVQLHRRPRARSIRNTRQALRDEVPLHLSLPGQPEGRPGCQEHPPESFKNGVRPPGS
jgi:hypothetical protein